MFGILLSICSVLLASPPSGNYCGSNTDLVPVYLILSFTNADVSLILSMNGQEQNVDNVDYTMSGNVVALDKTNQDLINFLKNLMIPLTPDNLSITYDSNKNVVTGTLSVGGQEMNMVGPHMVDGDKCGSIVQPTYAPTSIIPVTTASPKVSPKGNYCGTNTDLVPVYLILAFTDVDVSLILSMNGQEQKVNNVDYKMNGNVVALDKTNQDLIDFLKNLMIPLTPDNLSITYESNSNVVTGTLSVGGQEMNMVGPHMNSGDKCGSIIQPTSAPTSPIPVTTSTPTNSPDGNYCGSNTDLVPVYLILSFSQTDVSLILSMNGQEQTVNNVDYTMNGDVVALDKTNQDLIDFLKNLMIPLTPDNLSITYAIDSNVVTGTLSVGGQEMNMVGPHMNSGDKCGSIVQPTQGPKTTTSHIITTVSPTPSVLPVGEFCSELRNSQEDIDVIDVLFDFVDGTNLVNLFVYKLNGIKPDLKYDSVKNIKYAMSGDNFQFDPNDGGLILWLEKFFPGQQIFPENFKMSFDKEKNQIKISVKKSGVNVNFISDQLPKSYPTCGPVIPNPGYIGTSTGEMTTTTSGGSTTTPGPFDPISSGLFCGMSQPISGLHLFMSVVSNQDKLDLYVVIGSTLKYMRNIDYYIKNEKVFFLTDISSLLNSFTLPINEIEIATSGNDVSSASFKTQIGDGKIQSFVKKTGDDQTCGKIPDPETIGTTVAPTTPFIGTTTTPSFAVMSGMFFGLVIALIFC